MALNSPGETGGFSTRELSINTAPTLFLPPFHKPLVKQKGIKGFSSYYSGIKILLVKESPHTEKTFVLTCWRSPAWPGSLPCWQGGKPVRKTFSLRKCTVPSYAFSGCSTTTIKHQVGDFRINSHNTSAPVTAGLGLVLLKVSHKKLFHSF